MKHSFFRQIGRLKEIFNAARRKQPCIAIFETFESRHCYGDEKYQQRLLDEILEGTSGTVQSILNSFSFEPFRFQIFFTAASEGWGRHCFHRCVSVNGSRGGGGAG